MADLSNTNLEAKCAEFEKIVKELRDELKRYFEYIPSVHANGAMYIGKECVNPYTILTYTHNKFTALQKGTLDLYSIFHYMDLMATEIITLRKKLEDKEESNG